MKIPTTNPAILVKIPVPASRIQLQTQRLSRAPENAIARNGRMRGSDATHLGESTVMLYIPLPLYGGLWCSARKTRLPWGGV